MSKLEELIQKFCPDGVEFLALEQVIYSLNTGLNPRSFFRLNTDDAINYYVTIREIHNNKIEFSNSTDRINDEAMRLCNNRSNLEAGDVLFSGTGTIGETALITETPKNWNIKEGVYVLKPNTRKILSKFLMYLLQSYSVRDAYMKKAAGGTVKSIPMKELRKIAIPVPPLPVQREIVRILDNFTELTAELTVELTVELTARKKQYEYYLDQFYGGTYDEMLLLKKRTNWEVLPLSEIGTFTRGKRFVKADSEGLEDGIPCIHYGELYTYYGVSAEKSKSFLPPELSPKLRYAHKDDVIIVGTGENNIDIGVGVAWFGEDVAVHDACYIFRHKLNSKYLAYYLRTTIYHNQIKKYVSEGKICSISAQGLGKAIIPIPPIEEQQRIVDILDRFDTLCNDLASGLPAEIKARQKQYEYYRDKLLTFKEMEA